MNRTQKLVVIFLAGVVAVLALIIMIAPGIIDAKLSASGHGAVAARVFFIGSLAVLISLLAVGVTRKWRWTFWLITAAFVAGALRIPASGLQLANLLPTTDPAWYVVLQGAIGALQLVIGMLMVRGYRRAGPWGRF